MRKATAVKAVYRNICSQRDIYAERIEEARKEGYIGDKEANSLLKVLDDTHKNVTSFNLIAKMNLQPFCKELPKQTATIQRKLK